MKLKLRGVIVVVLLAAFLLPNPFTPRQVALGLGSGVAQAQTYDCASQTDIPAAQCQALVALHTATNGANWTDNTNWLVNPSPCAWFGISCSSGAVASIALSSNALSGTLPSALGNLPALASLSLYSNQLSGPIPTSLGSLTALTDLNLSGNRLSGSIPSQLGNLTNLTDLWLNNNQLTGPIPSQLGNFANLENLILYDNQLSGGIPSSLGNLGNLRTLFLSSNQLTGPIPPELGQLGQLTGLYIANNSLTGSIPPALGNLSNLEALRLSANQLNGGIPPELGNLTNLTELWLNNNQLTGALPTELGGLANLQHLVLYANQLSGPIPPQIGGLSQLLTLYLNDNNFTGAIPPQLGDIASLQTLYLSTNQLSGGIPTQLGNLTALTELYLQQNGLTGPIPAEVGNLAAVINLFLYSNQLSGPIPAQLGGMSNLQTLYLSDNQLEGTIPAALGNLAQLSTLYLNDNRLIGQLPTALGNAAQLGSIDLANNYFTGPLPASLSGLSNLTAFVYSGTGLCVPENDEALNNWLAAIPSVSSNGLLCGQIPTPDLVSLPNAARAGAQLRLIGQRLQPLGPYEIFLAGEATPLASATANEAGELNALVTIPADYTPQGAEAMLTLSAAFEPVGAVHSTPLAWLPPVGFGLSASSAQAGETVTATLANLYTGTVEISVGGTTVLGPLAVGSGGLVLPFVVPTGGNGTPLSVIALNRVNDLPFGQATAPFTPLPPSSFDFAEQPNATAEIVTTTLPAPWQLDQSLIITGSFPDIPQEMRGDVDLSVMYSDISGRTFPLTSSPLSLSSNGTFNAQVRWPSLLSGDPVASPAAGNLVITAQLDNVTKSIVKALPTQTTEAPFGLRIVATGTAQNDGKDIPITPNASAPLLIFRPQGIAYADAADLDAATFTDTLRAAFHSVYADQIREAIGTVVEKYFDCHPFVENDTFQPLAPIWYPPDRYKIISDFQNSPVVQMPTLVKQINAGPAAAAVQPATAASPSALVEVRFIYVTVDATEVKDGSIAPNGYGPPELIQWRRKFAYGGLYAVVPATGDIYRVNGFDINNVIKSISFERLPAGPVVIALQPYPPGTLPRLEFDVTVPGLNVLDIQYVPNSLGNGTMPVRTFGHLYSFKNFTADVDFRDDDLQIHVTVNDGYAEAQPLLSDMDMTLIPANGSAPVTLNISRESYGGDPCKTTPRVRFVGRVPKAGRALADGLHKVVVSIRDVGQQRISRQIELRTVLPPAYFGGAGFKSRIVKWSAAATELSATRYGASDDTKVPGDLQINPPKGPGPAPLHIDNASGLDNRILQTLAPAGPGLVRQISNSRATAWNNALPGQINSARQSSAASLWARSAAANRPVIPCDPNALNQQCIGPKSFSTPRKEMLLFPPIVWGIPPLADIRIAGTLAYLAGVDLSGVVNASIPPELTVQVWPYAEVSVAIDVAAQIVGGLIARLGANTSANIHADVPVTFSSSKKIDENACFRWFIEVRFYVKSVCIPYTNECAVEKDLDKRTILDGREPKTPFCNAQTNVVAADIADIPPSANPTIATDGVHMLALWNNAQNELVYSHFDGNAWSAALPVATGRVAERAAVIFFDTNRALAVWNGTTLGQVTGKTIDEAVAAQVLEYALWDGTDWSAPTRLAPSSSGDGGAVLASCPAGVADCPASGEVTVAWTHLADGIFSNLKLRLYTARFANGAWSAPQAVDPASSSLDTAPMLVYAAGVPVVGWVRDGDSSFATTTDRRIALRRLSTSAIEIPPALPTDIVAGSLAADGQGQLLLTYTRAPDGALLSNRHEIGAARQSCPGACTWSAGTLVDVHGRTLYGEQPVLTVDGQNRATITYRATGFGPDAQGNLVYPGDAAGITLGSGELAQIELNSQFAPASPRALTNAGVLNWQPTAVYNPALNQIIALSVHAPAAGVSAASADVAAQSMDAMLLRVSRERQPDYAIAGVETLYLSSTASLPASVVVTITNQGIGATVALPLEVAAAWDSPPLAAQQVSTATLAAVQAGGATSVSLPLPALDSDGGGAHRLYVTVNGKRALAESRLENNEIVLTFGGVPGPEQVYVTADPLIGLIHLQWDAPTRSGSIAGYRIYRRVGSGPWQPVGSAFGSNWADVNADFGVAYEYGVRAYTAAGVESEMSRGMKALMSPLPPVADRSTIFLPTISKRDGQP